VNKYSPENYKDKTTNRAVLPHSEFQLEGAQSVAKLLEETVNHVRTGTITPKIGQCIGYLACQMLRTLGGEAKL